MKRRKQITTVQLQKAVAQSSRMEGLSFVAARKSKDIIKVLQEHGRAFAISRQR